MKRSFRNPLRLFAAAAMLTAVACSPDGPIEPVSGPAFSVAFDVSLRICKAAVNAANDAFDPDAAGDYTYEVSFDGVRAPGSDFTIPAVDFFTGGCNSDANTHFLVVPAGTDDVTIVETLTATQQAKNTVLVAISSTGGVDVPCNVTQLAGNGSDEAGAAEFEVSATNCSVSGSQIIFKNTAEEEPPTGDEGCTPGYWKNHLDSWPPTGLDPDDPISSIFTGGTIYSATTLLDALSFGGGPGVDGAERILLRAAVAGALNALHPDVGWPASFAALQTAVNIALNSDNRDLILALAAQIDTLNNLGCPID